MARSKTLSFDIQFDYEDDKRGTLSISASGTVTEGSEGSWYDRHGDPGDAPEDCSVNVESCTITDENCVEVYSDTTKDYYPPWDVIDEHAIAAAR